MDSDQTTALDLPAIRAGAEAATSGPWEFDGEPHNIIIWSSPENRVCFMTSNGRPENNAMFIVGARTDIPALCDEVDRLRGEVARLKADLLDARITPPCGS
jgi:hypothetical protein